MNYTQTISAQRTCSKRIKGKTNFICVLHFVLRSFYNDGLFICGAKFLYFHIFIMTEQLTNSTENSTKNEHQTHDIKTGDQVRVDSHSRHLVRRPCWKNSISKGRKITSSEQGFTFTQLKPNHKPPILNLIPRVALLPQPFSFICAGAQHSPPPIYDGIICSTSSIMCGEAHTTHSLATPQGVRN